MVIHVCIFLVLSAQSADDDHGDVHHYTGQPLPVPPLVRAACLGDTRQRREQQSGPECCSDRGGCLKVKQHRLGFQWSPLQMTPPNERTSFSEVYKKLFLKDKLDVYIF